MLCIFQTAVLKKKKSIKNPLTFSVTRHQIMQMLATSRSLEGEAVVVILFFSTGAATINKTENTLQELLAYRNQDQLQCAYEYGRVERPLRIKWCSNDGCLPHLFIVEARAAIK